MLSVPVWLLALPAGNHIDAATKANFTKEVADGCNPSYFLWGTDAQWFADHDFCALDYPTETAWYEFIVFCILVISGIILAIIQYACTCARCKEIKPVTSVLYGSGRCLRHTDVCCDHFFSSEHCCMISCHHYQQKKDPAKALCKGCKLPPGACEKMAVSCFCDSHDKYKLQAIEDVELCDVLRCNNDKDKYPQYQKKTTCDFFTLLCWGWKPRKAKFQKLLLEAMTNGDPDRETYCADQVCSWLSGFRCFRFITSGGAAFFIFVYSIYVFSVAYRGFGDTLHFRQGVNTLYELGNNASQQFAPPEGVDVSTPAGNWNRGPIIGFKIADLSKKDTVNPYGKIMPGIWTLPGSDGGNATALPSPMPAELLPFSQYQETGQCPEGWERYQHDVQRRHARDMATVGRKKRIRGVTVKLWRNQGFCIRRAPNEYSAIARETFLADNPEMSVADFYAQELGGNVGGIDPLVSIEATITETPMRGEDNLPCLRQAIPVSGFICNCPNSSETGAVNNQDRVPWLKTGVTNLYFCNANDSVDITSTTLFEALARHAQRKSDGTEGAGVVVDEQGGGEALPETSAASANILHTASIHPITDIRMFPRFIEESGRARFPKLDFYKEKRWEDMLKDPFGQPDGFPFPAAGSNPDDLVDLHNFELTQPCEETKLGISNNVDWRKTLEHQLTCHLATNVVTLDAAPGNVVVEWDKEALEHDVVGGRVDCNVGYDMNIKPRAKTLEERQDHEPYICQANDGDPKGGFNILVKHDAGKGTENNPRMLLQWYFGYETERDWSTDCAIDRKELYNAVDSLGKMDRSEWTGFILANIFFGVVMFFKTCLALVDSANDDETNASLTEDQKNDSYRESVLGNIANEDDTVEDGHTEDQLKKMENSASMHVQCDLCSYSLLAVPTILVIVYSMFMVFASETVFEEYRLGMFSEENRLRADLRNNSLATYAQCTSDPGLNRALNTVVEHIVKKQMDGVSMVLFMASIISSILSLKKGIWDCYNVCADTDIGDDLVTAASLPFDPRPCCYKPVCSDSKRPYTMTFRKAIAAKKEDAENKAYFDRALKFAALSSVTQQPVALIADNSDDDVEFSERTSDPKVERSDNAAGDAGEYFEVGGASDDDNEGINNDSDCGDNFTVFEFLTV